MLYLIFCDIFVPWVFPPVLALLAFPALWVYAHLGILSNNPVNEHGYLLYIYVVMGICFIAHPVGMRTPHLQNTPGRLVSYMKQFIILMLVSEFIIMGIHFVLSLIFIRKIWGIDWSWHVAFGCMFLWGLLLDILATRFFLSISLPELTPETVRGVDLQDGDYIEWRAWLDV